LKEISYAIGSAFWAEPGAYEHRALRLLSEMILAGSPKLFFDPANQNAREIIMLERKVRSEINRAYIEAEYNSYFAPEARLRYTEVQSEYRIGGVVATRLSRKHKDDIIVSGQHYSGRYVIEARRGGNCHINVVDLLKEATRDLPILSLGGHPAAAGAGLPEEVSTQFFLALEQATRRFLHE
jgi:single-stranded DNA-specific DHH superfamily exonuclease